MPKLPSIFIAILLTNTISSSEACTTIIVGKKATVEGQTIIARTSDSVDARRAKNFKIYYDNNALKSYIGLPYWDVEADEENDMAQVATNRHGVSISATETIQSNQHVLALDPPVHSKNGISERNVPNVVMPRATTAREAVDILGSAIEERGVELTKGFGVLFADKNEAWYLETLSGHQWVAIKIPEEVYFAAANGPGQIQEYSPERYEYKLSNFNGKTPIEFAIEKGFSKTTEAGEFNFRQSYADIHNPINPNKNFVRLAYLQHYFTSSSQLFNQKTINKGEFPMFLRPDKAISVAEIQEIFASHYEDFEEFDPYQRHNKDESQRVFYNPIANVNTSNAHVTVIDEKLSSEDKEIANLEYIALGMPAVSFYLPIYYGITEIPTALTGLTDQADIENEKLFWQFRKLQALVFLSDAKRDITFNPLEKIKIIQQKYKTLAKEVEHSRLAMEANYRKNHDESLINKFTQNTVAKLSILNRQLIQQLMNDLSIHSKYSLQNEIDQAAWFTALVHAQDCGYKPEHCSSGLLKI